MTEEPNRAWRQSERRAVQFRGLGDHMLDFVLSFVCGLTCHATRGNRTDNRFDCSKLHYKAITLECVIHASAVVWQEAAGAAPSVSLPAQQDYACLRRRRGADFSPPAADCVERR